MENRLFLTCAVMLLEEVSEGGKLKGFSVDWYLVGWLVRLV